MKAPFLSLNDRKGAFMARQPVPPATCVATVTRLARNAGSAVLERATSGATCGPYGAPNATKAPHVATSDLPAGQPLGGEELRSRCHMWPLWRTQCDKGATCGNA